MTVQIGFTTLALGAVYRRLALLLAADLKRWSPSSRLVVLTDNPGEFAGQANVDAIAHRQTSIFRPYHDKRFTLRAHDDVAARMYLDADCRIFGPPSLVANGSAFGTLLANASWRLADKFEAEAKHEMQVIRGVRGRRTPVWGNTARNREHLVRAAAKAVRVDYECVTFVYEQCFCVPGSGKSLDAFIEVWGSVAGFLERRGLTWGEGEAIGIAAAAVGWDICELTGTKDWLFNDVFTRNRIQEGHSLDDREAALLREHDTVRSQAAPSSPLARRWQMVRPLVRNPLLGPSVYFRRWSTLRGL